MNTLVTDVHCLTCKLKALAFLKTDELKKEVQAEIEKAQRKGITGVPFTTLNGKWGISGGQSVFLVYKLEQC